MKDYSGGLKSLMFSLLAFGSGCIQKGQTSMFEILNLDLVRNHQVRLGLHVRQVQSRKMGVLTRKFRGIV